MKRRSVVTGAFALLGLGIMAKLAGTPSQGEAADMKKAFDIVKTEAEWKQTLTPEQFYILRKHGTEHPGSSPLNKEYRTGTFHCAGCEQALFSSETKYDSRSGWPSFWQPLEGATATSNDVSLMFPRTEVHCSRCGGHLGHVFKDGPKPTGLRYCLNGDALTFVPA
jgi:peptide-methionine (R)-S-oxide reductase